MARKKKIYTPVYTPSTTTQDYNYYPNEQIRNTGTAVKNVENGVLNVVHGQFKQGVRIIRTGLASSGTSNDFYISPNGKNFLLLGFIFSVSGSAAGNTTGTFTNTITGETLSQLELQNCTGASAAEHKTVSINYVIPLLYIGAQVFRITANAGCRVTCTVFGYEVAQ